MDSDVPLSFRPSGIDMFLDGDPTCRPERDTDRVSVISAKSDLRGAFLADENLSGHDLSGADLSGANLARADLSGAILFGANLVGATLHGAILDDADFTGADLERANLDGATGCRVGFGGANFRRASLSEAKLKDCSFVDADFTEADMRAAELVRARMTGADFTNCDATGACFTHSDMRDIEVTGACFDLADLREAKLTGIRGYTRAHWMGADIRDIAPLGVDRWKRFVGDQNYLDEFRNESRFSEAIYWLWWFTSDCGRSISRWALFSLSVIVMFGVVYSMVPIDFGMYATWLSPFYYSVVTMTSLGYGDVVPVSSTAQFVAMVQVLLGYIMLGGLISILSNKMARRSD